MQAMIEAAANDVYLQLKGLYPESHLNKAMNIAMDKAGATVSSEFVLPAIYTDTAGGNHIIAYDKADHFVVYRGEKAIVETKVVAVSREDFTTHNATAQLLRYHRNATHPSINIDVKHLYVLLFFSGVDPGEPKLIPVSILQVGSS